YLRAHFQMHCRHGESVSFFLERDGCFGLDPLGRLSRVVELRGQGHREAAGVSGGDELFGIRALTFLEARAEGVLRICEHTALRRNRSFAVFQTAVPNGGCATSHW